MSNNDDVKLQQL